MYQKNKIKLISVIYTACMLFVTSAKISVNAVNYGTADNYIIGDKGMAFIKTIDEDGNYLDIGSSSFKLYNVSGNQIGSWSGNNGNTFYCTDPKDNVASITSGSVSVGIDDMPDVLNNQEIPYCYEIGLNELKKEEKYDFKFGTTTDVTVKYNFSGDDNTALVLPPNSLCAAADAGWTQKQFNWGVDIKDYDADNFFFKDFAGSYQILTVPAGKYKYALGHTTGSTRLDSDIWDNMITASDKSSEYALKKIKLSDVYPWYFNSNGIYSKDFFGTQYNFNFGVDDLTNGVSACLVFFSGSVVTAPIPDADGYVSVYVDKSTNSFYMSVNCYAGSASGGGLTGIPGYPYRVKKFSFSTPSVPDKGIILSGMDEGQYTVKASYLPDEYEAEDSVFTIGPASDGIPECILTAKRKRYAVKVSQSQHGVICINDDITEAIKGQKISLFVVPDKGYICKNCRVTDQSGKDFDLDKELFDQEGIFYMPGEAVCIQAAFEINYGDINFDNRIDASDMVLLRKYILSDDTYELPFTADMNSNGEVDIFDYIRLMRLLVSSDTEQ